MDLPIPHCPLHVGVEMVMVSVKYKPSPGPDTQDLDASLKVRHAILRCPIAGCPRVDSFEKIAAEKEFANLDHPEWRACPRCGAATDAPVRRRLMYDYRCESCARYDRQKRKENKAGWGRRRYSKAVIHSASRSAGASASG